MSRGHDEVDGARNKSRITGVQQLFRGLALARAINDWTTASRESSARPARTNLIVFSHEKKHSNRIWDLYGKIFSRKGAKAAKKALGLVTKFQPADGAICAGAPTD